MSDKGSSWSEIALIENKYAEEQTNQLMTTSLADTLDLYTASMTMEDNLLDRDLQNCYKAMVWTQNRQQLRILKATDYMSECIQFYAKCYAHKNYLRLKNQQQEDKAQHGQCEQVFT